jgi:leucyl-tRNA synthetase
VKDGAKMSKSKGNVVNPDEYVRKFGADVLRTYLMFLAPFEQGGDFRDAGILGVERFLRRVWDAAHRAGVDARPAHGSGVQEKDRALHRAVKKVTEDIESLNYNTAISALMICLNEFERNPAPSRRHLEVFLKLLAPFAPHLAEEIWRNVLGRKTSIHREPWPAYDPKALIEDTFHLVIQVNGKARDGVEAPVGIGEAEAVRLALAREKVKGYIRAAKPRRVIYVPGRLVNFVL